MINILKKIISASLGKMGYSVVQKGSLKTITGKEFPFTPAIIPRKEYIFSHQMLHGYPNVDLDVYDIDCTKEDVRIAERLLESYQKAIKDEQYIANKPKNDLWVILQNSKHSDFIQLLKRNDPVVLAEYLCSMSRQNITHGMTQGLDNYIEIVSNERSMRLSAAYYMDKLVALGEALGCLPCESPESGRWGENLYTDIDELVTKIEGIIGIDISPPRISGGLFGVSSKRGLFHFRDIISIYTAWRIWELVKDKNNPVICEIGAGTGRVAYYSYKMGIKNYTIIDLPYVSIVSGYYLIKSLPEANIILYGEDNDEKQDSIKIYPYWYFKEIPDNYFDLTLNQDSFPEINYDTVIEYLHLIRCNTKQYFLSINQEGQARQTGPDNLQLVVSQLIRKLGNSYENVYRFPFWIREGYVEELFKIVKKF